MFRVIVSIILFFVAEVFSAQTSISGCYLSGGMSNGKTSGCGSGATPCNLAATSFSYFGAFCGSSVVSGSGSQQLVSTNFILPAGCQASVVAEMRPRTNISASGCTNGGPDGNDYISITNSGGTISSQGGTICCSGAACAAYPSLPGTPATVASASGFTTGCSNGIMVVEMVVTGGTLTISGNSDRADEITTYTINLTGTCGSGCSSVLPIILDNFYGSSETGGIRLNWRVATQSNTNYYLIQKSSDAVNWSDLFAVGANKEIAMNMLYQVFDPMPLPGINYYRLIDVDLDGSKNIHEKIAINYTSKTNLLLVDQTAENIVISARSDLKNVNLSITDITGRAIKKVKISENNSVILSKEETGKGVLLLGCDDFPQAGFTKLLVY